MNARRVLLAGVVVAFGGALAGLQGTRAAFVGTTANTGNSLAAAASFPDYPSAVVADGPLFYHRLDDAAGSVTAADASGNGLSGVYGTTNASGWTGLWPMDDASGNTATDKAAATTVHDLVVHSTSWTASGRTGSALSFNGSSSYADTSSSVVTTDGSTSFSVDAWVYLTATSTSRTAVSQDGANISAFELGYDSPTNRWLFQMPRTDSTSATLDKVTSGAAPTLAVWTHLTATFNTANKGMDLYVDGVKQTGQTFGGTPWNAGGALTVGAGLSGSRNHYWQGRVDNVRTIAALLGTSAAQELTLGPSGGPATSWQFDENTGTTSVDSAGHLNTATLGSSASWGTARSGTSAIDVPGDANGYASGATSGVDTRVAFTVSAWVYLDHTTLAAMSRVAVSQSAAIKSGFLLRYNHYGQQWEFAVNTGATDNYSASYDSSYSANNSASLNTWTHLVGVYDASAQTVTLYVNGTAKTAASHTSTFNATGALQAGRVKEFGDWQTGGSGGEPWGPWAGRIDDLKVFRRALSQQEITVLYNGGGTAATLGAPGALQGAQQGQTTSTAQAFSATARTSYNPTAYTNPTTYSIECWFRTAGVSGATKGQTLVSFSNKSNGNSTSFDRRLFLDLTGHLVAGSGSGVANIAQSSGTYFDGAWHHVVVTSSPTNGLKLYVDGALAATASYSAPGNFTGYWRWGGDTWTASWPADYFWLGELDEVAVYSTELSADRVAVHYHANH